MPKGGGANPWKPRTVRRRRVRWQSGQFPPGSASNGTLSNKLTNGGDYPIDNVVLVVADPGAVDSDPLRQLGTAAECVIGTILPKETIEDEMTVLFAADPAFGELTALALVLFSDTWNCHWARGPMLLERRETTARSC